MCQVRSWMRCKDGQLERPSSIDVKALAEMFLCTWNACYQAESVHYYWWDISNALFSKHFTFQNTMSLFFILFLWYLLNFIGKEWKTNSAMLYSGWRPLSRESITKMNASGLGFSQVLILGVPHTPSSGITLDFSMWPLNSNPITATGLLQAVHFWHINMAGLPQGVWLWTWRDFHNYFEPTWHRATSPYSLIWFLCTFP